MKKIKVGKSWTEIPITKGSLKVMSNGSILICSSRTQPTEEFGFEIGGWEKIKTFESPDRLWAKSKDGKDIHILVDTIYFDTLSSHRVTTPATLQSVDPSSASVNVGQTTRITWTFDKKVALEDFSESTLVHNRTYLDLVEFTYSQNTIVATFRGKAQGTDIVVLQNGATRQTSTVNVAQP